MTPSLAHHRRRQLSGLFAVLAVLFFTSATPAAVPVIEWSASGYAVAENAGTLTVRLNRSGDLSGTSAVNFFSTNGTAADGVDFTGVAGTLTFLPGETNHAVNIPLLDNPFAQAGRFFQLQIFTLSNAVSGLPTNAKVTVLDDESATVLDPWFDAGAGANEDVFSLAAIPDGRVIVGGQFTGFGGVAGLNHLAVLQADGAVDTSFNFSAGLPGGAVYAIAPRADGAIFIGGDFSGVGSVLRPFFALLKSSGGFDTNFPNVAVNNGLRAIILQPDGKILIAGRFTQVAGQTRNRIARLNRDGSLDASFNGSGANGNIRALALQADGKILVGGSFSTLDSYTRRNIGRLQTNGLLDLTFDPGSGADGQVRSVAVQADGKILLGGDFAQYDGYVHSGVARAQANGPADNDFDSGETPGTSVRAVAPAPDGQVWIGGSFTFAGGADRSYLARLRTNGTADSFRADAGFEVNTLLVQPDGRTLVAGDFGSIMGLSAGRIARLNTGALPVPGPQIQLTASNLFINETAGQTAVTVTRRGDYTVAAQVDFTTRHGSAIAGADYTPTIGTMTFAPQETAKILALPVLNDRLPETDETFFLALTNAAAPATLVGASNLTVTITSDDTGFEFTADTYATSEPAGLVTIGVRLQATGEGAVSVDFRAVTGTATAGTDFLATNGTLIFQAGETQKTFTVTILADALTEGIENAHLLLTNASPGSALGARTNATLSIDDVDSTIQWAYATLPSESDGSLSAVIRRSGNLTLPATVDWFTTDGTATAGLDYASASGSAIFQAGQVSAYVGVTLLNDGLVEGTETIYFDLGNASSGSKLGVNTNVFASVLDNDAGMAFSVTNVFGNEISPSVALTVQRHDDGTVPLSIEYFTTDGTALSGVNYGAQTGTINFPASSNFATVTIPLLDQCGLTNARQFAVTLRNPSAGGALGADTQAVVTIYGNDAAGQRDHSFIQAPIASRLGVLPNGQILSARERTFLLHSDGSIDSTVDYRPYPYNSLYFVLETDAMVIQRDGKILFSGTSLDIIFSLGCASWLSRMLPSGDLDPDFIILDELIEQGLGGTYPGNSSVIEQPDGRILVGRNAYNPWPPLSPPPAHSGIARLLANGTFDPDFSAGTGAQFSEEASGVQALALQPDGRILIGGLFTNFSGYPRLGLARLDTNGAVEAGFVPYGGARQLNVSEIKLQQDGKLLIVGAFSNLFGTTISGLARLFTNGLIDTSFNPMPITGGTVRKILLQPNGRIVIGGSFTNVQGHARFGLARLNSNGTLDQTFDPAPDQYGDVIALALQPDGRILVSDASTGLWRVAGDPVSRVRQLARTNGVAWLRLESRTGKTYALEGSTNLVNWLRLQTNTAADCALEFLDAGSPAGHRFYRAVQLSP